MVDIKALKKKPLQTRQPQEVLVEQDVAETSPAPQTNYLDAPPRTATVPKQFRLPNDVLLDFEITARERGFRNYSKFFIEVWDFWKQHHA